MSSSWLTYTVTCGFLCNREDLYHVGVFRSERTSHSLTSCVTLVTLTAYLSGMHAGGIGSTHCNACTVKYSFEVAWLLISSTPVVCDLMKSWQAIILILNQAFSFWSLIFKFLLKIKLLENSVTVNRLTPNDAYMGSTAPVTSKSCIFLYLFNKYRYWRF